MLNILIRVSLAGGGGGGEILGPPLYVHTNAWMLTVGHTNLAGGGGGGDPRPPLFMYILMHGC